MGLIIEMALLWMGMGVMTMTLDWATGFPRILQNRTGIMRLMAREIAEQGEEHDPRYGIVFGFVVAHIILGPFSVFIDGSNFK